MLGDRHTENKENNLIKWSYIKRDDIGQVPFTKILKGKLYHWQKMECFPEITWRVTWNSVEELGYSIPNLLGSIGLIISTWRLQEIWGW